MQVGAGLQGARKARGRLNSHLKMQRGGRDLGGKINVRCKDLPTLKAEPCLPMYGKSPEGLYSSILYRLLPLSDPVRV